MDYILKFTRFHCENKPTLPCSICRPTNIENIYGKCKTRTSFWTVAGVKFDKKFVKINIEV